MPNKVTSGYLGIELEVDTYESDGKVIISHLSLEDIAYNQMPKEINFKTKTEILYVNGTHCVAKCTVSDRNGRVIEAIGESTSNSLTTSVAKMYPALIAAQRAFDRAFIRYLNLPGKVYSDTEGVANPIAEVVSATIFEEKDSNEPSIISFEEQAPETNEQKPKKVVATQKAPQEPKKAESTQNKPVEQKPAGQKPAANKPVEQAAQAKQAEDPGDVVLDMGRYKEQGKTIKEINEEGNYIEWIVEKYNPKDEKGKMYKKYCQDYLNSLK